LIQIIFAKILKCYLIKVHLSHWAHIIPHTLGLSLRLPIEIYLILIYILWPCTHSAIYPLRQHIYLPFPHLSALNFRSFPLPTKAIGKFAVSHIRCRRPT